MPRKQPSSAPVPSYTYVFRRWLADAGEPIGQQSEVVILTSIAPLYPDQLLARLEELVPYAKECVLVDIPDGSVLRLDTYEPAIESMTPPKSLGIRLWREWWSASDEYVVEDTDV